MVLRADTAYWLVGLLGVGLGLGSGAVMLPAMTVASRRLTGADLASGSTLLALGSQLAAALGTASFSGAYAAAVAWRAPGLDGGLQGVSCLSVEARELVAPGLVEAQRLTTLGALTLVLVAIGVARGLSVRPAEGRPPRIEGPSPATACAGGAER